mmetsp:Transcript_9492/g.19197  ORF Transcript_9492/g.19197 Transcript_9492/m.19197 type:complete len:511 (+) Transcript_9492:483-2015(+)
MQPEGDGHREQQPRVHPRRHGKERAVLGDCVERIEHLDGHEHRERHGGGGLLARAAEVGAWLGRKVHAAVGRPRPERRRPILVEAQLGKLRALAPVGELAVGDERVRILGPIVPHVPIDEDADGGEADVNADDHVAEEDPRRDELIVGVARRLLHDVGVGRVEAERGGGRPIGDEVDPEQLQRDEALRQSEQRGDEDGGHLADVGRDEVADEGFHVGVDGATLLDGGHDGGEVVIGEHHVSRLLGHLRARNAHGNADGRLLERGRVVDSVARHGGDLAGLAQDLDELLLVARLGAAEDHRGAVRGEERRALLRRQVEELGAGEGAAVDGLLGAEDANLARDGLGRRLGVAGDHDDTDAGGGARVDGRCDLGPRGVLDARQPDEHHVGLELLEFADVRQPLVRRVGRPVVVNQVAHVLADGHGQRAQRARRQLAHLGKDGLAVGGAQRHRRAVGQSCGGAPLEDRLGRALAVDHVLARAARRTSDLARAQCAAGRAGGGGGGGRFARGVAA